MGLPFIGAALGGLASRAVGWGVRQIRGEAGRVAKRAVSAVVGGGAAVGRQAGKIARSPAGSVAITVGTGVAVERATRGRGAGGSVREQVEQTYADFGVPVDANGASYWTAEISAGRATLTDLQNALVAIGGVAQGGGMAMGGGGAFGQLVVAPEQYTGMRCPPGYSLYDFGDGPACYPTKVLRALGLKKARARGGITAREVQAAKKVQRFGSKLFVNKVPKTKLRKGRR